MSAGFTPGPWHLYQHFATPMPDRFDVVGATRDDDIADNATEANAHLIAAAPDQNAALNYVADMTFIGTDCEWHFKPGYDPQVVLDALAKARGEVA